jgi:hypothetical protein
MFDTILLGKPCFTDSGLAKIAASDDLTTVWQAAFGRHETNAPAHVAGDFAVAVEIPQGTIR